MERIWDYQRYAAECVLLAEELADPAHKARLLAMARGWLHLAELARKNSQNDVVYEPPMMAMRSRGGGKPTTSP